MPARPGAGRPKGSLNKATKEIKTLAQEYAPKAMKELARLAANAKSEQARCTAIGMLLDRGYGKPVQVNENHNITYRAGELSDDELAGIVADRSGDGAATPKENTPKLH